MMDTLPFNPLILVAMAVIALVTTAFFTVYGTSADRRMRKRMNQVLLLEGPSTGIGSAGGTKTAQPHSLKAGGNRKGRTQTIDEKLKQLIPNVAAMRLKLERAGLTISVTGLMLIVFGLMTFVTALLATAGGQKLTLAMLCGGAAGIALPTMFISIRGKKRARAFLTDLPDAIDLIVRSVRSGLPVTEAIHAIARDMTGPAAEEFKQISDQMRIGIPMDDALQRSVDRLGLADYSFLAVSMSITRRTGGNLSETLGNLSRLLRSRQQMHLKIRALSSEARASALIIGVLPFVVIGALLVISPDYVTVLFTDPAGQDVLTFAGVSMGFGFAVMAKMVRFDF